MDHSNVSTEITFHHEPGPVKRIWKVFWILLIITMVELGLGISLYLLDLPEGLRMHLIKGTIIILSLAKAYYIVSVFMHLGDEIRAGRKVPRLQDCGESLLLQVPGDPLGGRAVGRSIADKEVLHLPASLASKRPDGPIFEPSAPVLMEAALMTFTNTHRRRRRSLD